MKTCNRCGVSKEMSNFSKRKSGHQPYCKACQRAYSKNHYTENKKYYVDKAKVSTGVSREKFNELKNKPCADCGKAYPPYVMDFDHLDGEEKLGNIGNTYAMTKSLSWAIEEAKKCDIVCANCHRERTHKRILERRLRAGHLALTQ